MLAALGVSSIVLLDLVIRFQGRKDGATWSSLSPFSLHGISVQTLLLSVGVAQRMELGRRLADMR
ncbi:MULTISPECIES: hypothetical protein [unclassified Streptomyces]|uniref:Uncharacterized protein n=1 Tax=Streptomyces sp. NBC_00119 TaxID=2975659 RepID=A0AAU1UI63_9ACTN|nr:MULTISPECIES: hypothetical protein [unclassified Streptomyces]MCX4647943.1 hypothetical protein [Streptomyces sp. NBC_01446]MCX5320521.1 hypothetical protein [Streptomyces sp. NBC_00120]